MNKATLQYIQLVYFYRLLLIRQLALFNLLSLLAESLQVNETPLEENENAKEPPLEPAVCAEKWRWRRKDTSQEEDPETSLYYYGARYYDPGIGRFLSADTMADEGGGNMGYNRYMYAAGNPVKFNDPTGHFILEAMLIGAIIGAVIGAVSGYVSYGISTGDWAMSNSEAAWTEIGIGAAVGLLAGIAGAAAGAGIVAGASLTGLEAAIVGGFYAGAAGGFVGGASNTWFHGGSFEDGMLAGVQGAIIGGAVGGAMGAISYGIGQLFQGNPVNQTEVALLDDKIDVALGESSGDSSIPSGCPVQSDCSSSSGFSYGRSLNGQTQAHLGTDIRAEIGTPTYSTMDGEVVKINFASSGGRGGNEIVIANQRYGTTYSHLSRIDVTLGQTITRGQLIGLTGATGYVTGPHLHYGILVYGTYVPPGIFINWGR